jgi:hypothetical protein
LQLDLRRHYDRYQISDGMQQTYTQGCGADRQTQIRQIQQHFPPLGTGSGHCFFHDPVSFFRGYISRPHQESGFLSGGA